MTALLFSTIPTAYAVPQSKVDAARAAKAQVERLLTSAEIATERYNEADDRYDKFVAQKRAADKRLLKVRKRMGVVQGHLSDRANSMYRQGPIGFASVLFGADSFEEFATTWDILHDLNQGDAEAVAELKVLRAKVRSTQKEIAAKKRAAKKEADIKRAKESAIKADLAKARAESRGLEAEIAALKAAEERARAASYTSWSSAPARSFPPPTRAPRGEVVSIARRYLGAPYVWAADGPNSFDCSGFTMFVYRQVGVSLPHSSRAQINYGQRVSRSDLAPGDLVFFGSPIHHVGMYVGGGSYIHAPSSGDVVKISSLSRSDYAGACRP